MDDARRISTESPIGDIAYLARSAHRVPTLVALTERPRSRSELCELAGVSSSTIRRTLGEFESRSWIHRDGYRYEATRLGETIASGMEAVIDRVETERRLRAVSRWLPDEVIDVVIEAHSAATVTVAEHDDPYRPVNRYRSLFHETDTYRFVGFDVGLYEPCKDEFQRRVLDGLDAELIDSPSATSYMFSTYPERCATLLESGNLTALVHDDVPPYGVCLFDDRIAITCYSPDSGGVTALIDTDAPVVREWAESTYAAYRADARPVDAGHLLE